MEGTVFDVFRVLSLVVVWAIPALLILAVVVFTFLAPATALAGAVLRLFAAVRGKLQRKARAEKQLVSEVGKLVAKAGLTIQEEAPRHCWEILHCSLERREACPAYARRDIPGWVAVGLGKDERISDVCVNHTLIDLRALPRQA